MRITDLRVDGFGVLADLQINDLPPGLTVLYGPNEAGKSTLLDFIRGVLFGFPDRRTKLAYHEPLRGGRHGGALTIATDDGQRLHLERHVNTRHPLLSSLDGKRLDESELHQLLGGADDALFRTVFAFGLSELSSLEALDRDEVRDMVFSAGVLGAGRSATRTTRALEGRRAGLVRPRQQDALANQLRRRLEEVEERLRTARAASEGYPQAATRFERLEQEARHARQQSELAHLRAGELHRVLSCWPTWRRRMQAGEALHELGELDQCTLRLLAQDVEIRRLSSELSGHEERVRHIADRERQLVGIEQKLDADLRSLGEGIELSRLPLVGPEQEAQISALIEARRQRRAELRAFEDESARFETEVATAQDQLERCPQDGPFGDDHHLERARRAAEDLQALVSTRDRLEQELSSIEREQALRRLAHGRPSGIGQRQLVVGALLLIAGMAVALTGAGHRLVALTVLGIAAVVLVLVGLALLAGRARHDQMPSDPFDATRREDLSRINDRIAPLAIPFGLGERPQSPRIAAVLTDLEAERRSQQRRAELARECAKAAQRLEQANIRSSVARRAILDLDDQLTVEAERFGIAQAHATAPILEQLATIKEAQELDGARRRVQSDIEEVTILVADFDQRLAAVLKTVELDGLTGDGLTGDRPYASNLAFLAERLGLAQEKLARRNKLERTIAAADGDLLEALGSGDAAERLLDEISHGTLLAWEQEQRELTELTAALDDVDERSVAELTSAERDLVRLRDSDEIAALEIERASLSAELERALEQWLLLGLAKSLLEQTLERYEKERQPVVIARAAELFAKVTGGRYQQLVARDETDTGRRHGIEAVSATGQRVDSGDLSRGTAEQLYLCLRLAFATTFAERSISLPLVLDDVLVNFDPARAEAVAEAVAVAAGDHQVLAFTCHPHVVDCFTSVSPNARVVRLERNGTGEEAGPGKFRSIDEVGTSLR